MNEVLEKIVEQARSQQGVEIAAVFWGIVCVWQTVRENPWCWLTGTIQVVLTGYVVFRAQLYADFVLQILYVVLNGYGLYQWLYGGEKKTSLKVVRLAGREVAIGIFLLIPAVTIAEVQLLRYFQVDSKTYWLDALTTALSLFAQVSMSHKKLENWLVWIVANVLYIGLYGYKGLYYFAAMQVIFIALSVRGWLDWRRALVKPEPLVQVTCPSAI